MVGDHYEVKVDGVWADHAQNPAMTCLEHKAYVSL
jgi:hypothetical protein